MLCLRMSAKQSSSETTGSGGGHTVVPTTKNNNNCNNSKSNNGNTKNTNKKTNKKSLKLSKAQKIKNNNNLTNNKNNKSDNNIANVISSSSRSNSNSNSNSSNNTNKTNKSHDEQIVTDEIIEEFDFSDSDLAELNAYGGDVHNVEKTLQNISIEQGVKVQKIENIEAQTSVNTTDSLTKQVKDEASKAAETEVKDGQTTDKNSKPNITTVITAQEDLLTYHNNSMKTEGCQEIVNMAGNNGDGDMTKLTNATNTTTTSALQTNGDHNDTESNDNDNECGDEPYDDLLVQILDEANDIAEARLAARRQARAEAREIRMRELERQQKEQEVNADRVFDMHTTASGIDPLSRTRLGLGSTSPAISGLLNSTRVGNSMSSRRSSEDSLEEEGRSLRDIRHELKDVEERFRKAMIANAQLDNERASQTYQIQLLKDKLEDMEESHAQLQREFKEKSRDCNALKRSLDKLSEELKLVQGQLNERDTLIAEQGLVIVAVENEDGTDAKRALVSVENAQLLGSVQGSLDVRLKKFTEEKQQLQAEVQQLQDQLETFKSQGKGRGRGNSLNGPLGSDDDDYEAQREANKIISDYKYKLQKAEQEIASLQSSLARSETQVIRYKSTAEAAEKAESELKIERRKLQRENREAMEKIEELETANNHLIKRLDKIKTAKSAFLKEL